MGEAVAVVQLHACQTNFGHHLAGGGGGKK